MARLPKPKFNHKNHYYPADGVIAVVAVDETHVQVRWANRKVVILNDASVEEVLVKIQAAKSRTDSA